MVRRSLFAACLTLFACAREPEPRFCPDISIGDLAFSEIRKGGDNSDPDGSWVEVFNASGNALDLRGISLRFARRDGSGETNVVVRRSIEVPRDGYAVFGLFDDAMLPAHVDYGFQADFDMAFPSASGLDCNACGELIDRVSYDSLPSDGTYALGVTPPSAEQNDFPAMWCKDGTMMGTAFPGTPGAANPPCP